MITGNAAKKLKGRERQAGTGFALSTEQERCGQWGAARISTHGGCRDMGYVWPCPYPCPGVPPAGGVQGDAWSTPTLQGRSQDLGARGQSGGLQESLPGWSLYIPRVSNQKALAKPSLAPKCSGPWCSRAGRVCRSPPSRSQRTGQGGHRPFAHRDGSIAFSKGSIPWCSMRKTRAGNGEVVCRRLGKPLALCLLVLAMGSCWAAAQTTGKWPSAALRCVTPVRLGAEGAWPG